MIIGVFQVFDVVGRMTPQVHHHTMTHRYTHDTHATKLKKLRVAYGL